jgi:hypothetical protein
LEQGDIETIILKRCQREGLQLPERIKNAPDLYIGLELYYLSFFDLSSCRTGMGDGPISWIAIEQYARLNEFSEEQREDLHHHIRSMDQVYLKWSSKKNDKS